MKKNTLILASLVSAVLALSACGGGSSDGPELTPAPVEPATAASEPAGDEPARSPRGNLIKKVGEPALVLAKANTDDWALNFTVTGIEIDPVCTNPAAQPSENGHLIAISIEAATAPEPVFTEILQYAISFGSGWKVIASNGTTVNSVSSNATLNCLPDSETLTGGIGAAERVAGKVLLDVPDTAGTLVFSTGGGTGWEWEFPTK